MDIPGGMPRPGGIPGIPGNPDIGGGGIPIIPDIPPIIPGIPIMKGGNIPGGGAGIPICIEEWYVNMRGHRREERLTGKCEGGGGIICMGKPAMGRFCIADAGGMGKLGIPAKGMFGFAARF